MELYRLLDWLMRLPEDLDREYKRELREYEERRAMPYITSNERVSREEGRQEGRQEGLQEGLQKGLQKGQLTALHESALDNLEVRFGEVPFGVFELVKASRDVAQLKSWRRLSVTSPTLVEFERALRE